MTDAAPPAKHSERWTGLGTGLVPPLFVLLWSTGFIGAKLGMPHAEPFTFLLVRYAVVGSVLLATALVLRTPWPESRMLTARVALVGVLIHGFYLGGVFFAISRGVPAGITALIVGLQPLLTAFASGPYLGERLSPLQWIGLALGFAGVTLVVADKLTFRGGDLAGLIAALVALVCITAGTLYQKRHGARMPLITGSFVQFAAAGLATLPVALLSESLHVEWTGSFVFALLWLCFVLSIGAITLLHMLIRHGAAARVASLFYLTPAVTAVLAWLIFGELLSPVAVIGMLVAAIGVALVTRSARR